MLGARRRRRAGAGALVAACCALLVPVPLVAQVGMSATAFTVSDTCSGRFVRHPLLHTTAAADSPARFFDSNGAGVALADLDDDGRIDIALAGLRAPATLRDLRNDSVFRDDVASRQPESDGILRSEGQT